MRYKKKWYKKVLLFLFFAAALIWTLVPVYIVISNSFRRTLDMKIMPPKLLFTPILSHYEKILTLDNFSKYFRNSAVIAVSVTALTILLGTLAAYGMKLFKSRLILTAEKGKTKPSRLHFAILTLGHAVSMFIFVFCLLVPKSFFLS